MRGRVSQLFYKIKRMLHNALLLNFRAFYVCTRQARNKYSCTLFIDKINLKLNLIDTCTDLKHLI